VVLARSTSTTSTAAADQHAAIDPVGQQGHVETHALPLISERADAEAQRVEVMNPSASRWRYTESVSKVAKSSGRASAASAGPPR